MTTKDRMAVTVAPGEVETLNVFGVRVEVLITGEETGGAYSSYRVTAEPGQGPVPHVHDNEDESFYVLEGRFEVLQGERTVTVEEGGFAFLPRHLSHAFKNVGTGTGRLLGFAAPAGHDRFFRDIDALGERALTDFEAALEVCRRHGIEIGPPERDGDAI
jgi:quercetin dioxygenase-like cupin family protein